MPTYTSISSTSIAIIMLFPVLASILVYHLDTFDPAPLPLHELTQPPLNAPLKNSKMLKGSEFVGEGSLKGPDDIVFDKEMNVIYTSCEDGWIKRVRVNECDIYECDITHFMQGLLNISRNGEIELLSNEVDGAKIKFTDGVAIAEDGNIYFTEASTKYDLNEYPFDILEGKPNGRLLRFDPATRKTTLLVDQLYFANGVAVSPLQDYIVFCETSMQRCRKYYIKGNKNGTIEKFVDNLPGLPDNIHYSHGHYWIALPTENTFIWKAMAKYPVIRKAAAIIAKTTGIKHIEKNSGVTWRENQKLITTILIFHSLQVASGLAITCTVVPLPIPILSVSILTRILLYNPLHI